MLRFGAVGVGLVYGSIKMSYYKVLPGLLPARGGLSLRASHHPEHPSSGPYMQQFVKASFARLHPWSVANPLAVAGVSAEPSCEGGQAGAPLRARPGAERGWGCGEQQPDGCCRALPACSSIMLILSPLPLSSLLPLLPTQHLTSVPTHCENEPASRCLFVQGNGDWQQSEERAFGGCRSCRRAELQG